MHTRSLTLRRPRPRRQPWRPRWRLMVKQFWWLRRSRSISAGVVDAGAAVVAGMVAAPASLGVEADPWAGEDVVSPLTIGLRAVVVVVVAVADVAGVTLRLAAGAHSRAAGMVAAALQAGVAAVEPSGKVAAGAVVPPPPKRAWGCSAPTARVLAARCS